VNAFGLPIPKEGEELAVRFEEGPTRQHPEQKCLKSRHPSGVMLFIHRDFLHMEVKIGERWKCRILKVCISIEQTRGSAFVQPINKIINQEHTIGRLSPDVANALMIGIDIEVKRIEELKGDKLKQQSFLLNRKAELNTVLQTINDQLSDLNNDIEELDDSKQHLEDARNKYEPHTVTDEIVNDKSAEAGPHIIEDGVSHC
jgi:hypothetical protein